MAKPIAKVFASGNGHHWQICTTSGSATSKRRPVVPSAGLIVRWRLLSFAALAEAAGCLTAAHVTGMRRSCSSQPVTAHPLLELAIETRVPLSARNPLITLSKGKRRGSHRRWKLQAHQGDLFTLACCCLLRTCPFRGHPTGAGVLPHSPAPTTTDPPRSCQVTASPWRSEPPLAHWMALPQPACDSCGSQVTRIRGYISLASSLITDSRDPRSWITWCQNITRVLHVALGATSL